MTGSETCQDGELLFDQMAAFVTAARSADSESPPTDRPPAFGVKAIRSNRRRISRVAVS